MRKLVILRVGENRRIWGEKYLIFNDFGVPRWYPDVSKNYFGNVFDLVRIPDAISMISVDLGCPGFPKPIDC